MPRNCPVCNTVNENRTKCSQCGWDLTPVNLSEYPKTILEKWQNDQNWAKKVWKQKSGFKEISDKIDNLTRSVNELTKPKNTPLSSPNLEEPLQPKLTAEIAQLKGQLQAMSARMQKLETDNSSLQDEVKKLQNNQVTKFQTDPFLPEFIPHDRREVTKFQSDPWPEVIPSETTAQINPYNTTLSPSEEEIVRQYSSDSVSAQVIEVGVTVDSLNRHHNDLTQPLELERSNGGGYWITQKGDSYYLGPKSGLRITQAKYDGSTKILFECLNYQEGITKSWQLLKPAKVSLIGEIWQLKERGVLQFN